MSGAKGLLTYQLPANKYAPGNIDHSPISAKSIICCIKHYKELIRIELEREIKREVLLSVTP